MNNGHLSRITIIFGIYIVISASFMLQVNLWLTGKIGDALLAYCFQAIVLLALIASIVYVSVQRPNISRVCVVVTLFILGYLLGVWQSDFSENTHIVIYGLLGYLAARDLTGTENTNKLKYVVMAAGFVVLVSACDETFQLILPYRFGDIKDFVTNMLGGMIGIGLFLALKRRTAV